MDVVGQLVHIHLHHLTLSNLPSFVAVPFDYSLGFGAASLQPLILLYCLLLTFYYCGSPFLCYAINIKDCHLPLIRLRVLCYAINIKDCHLSLIRLRVLCYAINIKDCHLSSIRLRVM
jgi:hypothetical protein